MFVHIQGLQQREPGPSLSRIYFLQNGEIGDSVGPEKAEIHRNLPMAFSLNPRSPKWEPSQILPEERNKLLNIKPSSSCVLFIQGHILFSHDQIWPKKVWNDQKYDLKINLTLLSLMINITLSAIWLWDINQ